MTSVSVIIPCYNAAATIAETVDSALAQAADRVTVEVIVINDGSTDSSLEVARRFEPQIRVLTGPNQGASAARNRGIAESTGQWIVFLDADDIMEPRSLIQNLTAARTQNADVVICDWIDFDDDGSGSFVERAHRSIDWPAMQADPEIAIATRVWAPTAAILYSRTIVERIGGFNPRLPIIQDARFLFDAAHQGARFARAPHIGARYRILTGSLSRSNATLFAQDLLVNTTEIGTLWRARGPLGDLQRRTLMDMLNTTGRALFAAGHPDYFAAAQAQRDLEMPLPLHTRLAPVLARLLGFCGARRVISMFGRA